MSPLLREDGHNDTDVQRTREGNEDGRPRRPEVRFEINIPFTVHQLGQKDFSVLAFHFRRNFVTRGENPRAGLPPTRCVDPMRRGKA